MVKAEKQMEKIIIAFMLGTAFWILFKDDSPHKIVYDCRLAEISVDYPAQVKDECRRLNANNA